MDPWLIQKMVQLPLLLTLPWAQLQHTLADVDLSLLGMKNELAKPMQNGLEMNQFAKVIIKN